MLRLQIIFMLTQMLNKKYTNIRNEHCAVIVKTVACSFLGLKVFMVKLYQNRYPNESCSSWL